MYVYIYIFVCKNTYSCPYKVLRGCCRLLYLKFYFMNAVFIYIYIYIYVCIYIYTFMDMYIYIYVCIYTYTHIHIYICVYICTFIYIYIHMYLLFGVSNTHNSSSNLGPSVSPDSPSGPGGVEALR
jgi:hypothetical protein